ncbi:beta/gamma crystallin-related protein [Nostoc sp.]|uniref:beta/gamma crystallin-related protein n=1 Tax=Nostoc sp. TaxID=1180 RepID=UPI002FF62304
MSNTKENFNQLDVTLAVKELDNEVAATCSGGAPKFYTGGSNPDVILYDDINFGSKAALPINAELYGGDSNLDNSAIGSGWNNRTSSIKVIRGTWKIYRDSGYKGTVVTLKPGSYPNPKAFGLPNDSLTGIIRVG